MLSKLKRLRDYRREDLFRILWLVGLLLKAECTLRLMRSGKILEKLQARRSPGRPARKTRLDPEALYRLIRLVETADRQHGLPPSCVRKALVLKNLLSARGLDCELRVGIQRDGEGLQAHAWIELEGTRLEGPGSNLDFKLLQTFSPSPHS